MVSNFRRLLVLSLAVLCLNRVVSPGEKFYSDDPIQSMPKPRPVKDIKTRKVPTLYDFLLNSSRAERRPAVPAQAVNTLGEVPDSEWFTNRHGRRRLSRDELQRGPGNDHPPVPPYVVVGAKSEGITPGFRMKDSAGRLYFVKPDPISHPEMATAADVIGSKFFYAIGYNTPENYIVYVQRSDLSVGQGAMVERRNRRRPMTNKDVEILLDNVPRSEDGSCRLLASLAVEGEPVGPFRYEGTRSDDPNDTVPHEQRRDLRGLYVFCAWLNHTDSKAGNSLNSIVEEGGIRFVRHYLIDFGAILGSDSDMAKNARFGHEYVLPTGRQALASIGSLGLYSPDWERAKYPQQRAIGRFESQIFDPDKWKSNYPNPAFLSRLPDDEYWAAKQVMAFTDEDIRAIVETGKYSDPRVVDYTISTLTARRDKIGRTYFSKVLPLDHFNVASEELRFEDLAVTHHYVQPRQYQVKWQRFDNQTQRETQLPAAASSFRLPPEVKQAVAGSYFSAHIHADGDDQKSVTVYLRKTGTELQVVGIERKW